MTDEKLKKLIRSCYSKKLYKSEGKANRKILAINKHRKIKLRSYYCAECCCWHHTSKGIK